MHSFPEIAIGAIVAALISGGIALLGLIISKEQKISEFRQAWVDAVRDDLSKLISHAAEIHQKKINGKWDSLDAGNDDRNSAVELNIAIMKVRLRLNPSKEIAKPVLADILKLEELLIAPYRPTSFADFNPIELQLRTNAQVLLKYEWNRVKAGEPVFKATKWGASILILCAVIAFAFVEVQNYRSQSNTSPATSPADTRKATDPKK
jgi:septum formation topological specificity factor MinE